MDERREQEKHQQELEGSEIKTSSDFGSVEETVHHEHAKVSVSEETLVSDREMKKARDRAEKEAGNLSVDQLILKPNHLDPPVISHESDSVEADNQDDVINEWKAKHGGGPLTKLGRWARGTKAGRASLAGLAAMIGFFSVGGKDKLTQFTHSLDTGVHQEAFLQAIDLPKAHFDGREVSIEMQKKSDVLDVALTEALYESGIQNIRPNIDAILVICGHEVDGKNVLDAEKMVHIYGNQINRTFMDIDSLTETLEPITGHTPLETNVTGKIIRSTFVELPPGAMGGAFVPFQYRGTERFIGQIDDRDIKPLYDELYESEVDLIDSMMDRVDFENLDKAQQREAKELMTSVAGDFIDVELTGMAVSRATFSANSSSIGKEWEKQIFESFTAVHLKEKMEGKIQRLIEVAEQKDGLLAQYKTQKSEFVESMDVFDAFAEHVGASGQEDQFIETANQVTASVDTHIADLFDEKGWGEEADHIRPDSSGETMAINNK